jgi:transposase
VARLRSWAEQWVQRRWAIEGAAGLGRGVAQALAAARELVVDVPAQLAARARLLNTGHARKTDSIDAASVAMVGLHHPQLHAVRTEDHSSVLRLLSERRDDLADQRTRSANRLHALLRELIPGGAPRNLRAEQATTLLRAVHPFSPADQLRKQLARDLVAELRRLDTALTQNATDIAAALTAHGTSLTQIHGLGPRREDPGSHQRGRALPDPPSLRQLVRHRADRGLQRDQRRHRLSRAGNRQLNRALDLVAVCQIRTNGPGREFYQRKLAESKTPAESRRALKRRLCRHTAHLRAWIGSVASKPGRLAVPGSTRAAQLVAIGSAERPRHSWSTGAAHGDSRSSPGFR